MKAYDDIHILVERVKNIQDPIAKQLALTQVNEEVRDFKKRNKNLSIDELKIIENSLTEMAFDVLGTTLEALTKK